MRRITQKRHTGRNFVAGQLRLIIGELEKLSKEATYPELTQVVRKVVKELDKTLDMVDGFELKGKRLRAALSREKRHLEALLEIVVTTPVLPEEKAAAQVKRRAEKLRKERQKKK